jgi:hypothetical protein
MSSLKCKVGDFVKMNESAKHLGFFDTKIREVVEIDEFFNIVTIFPVLDVTKSSEIHMCYLDFYKEAPSKFEKFYDSTI